MKGERKYLFILGGVALAYLCVQMLAPRKHDWKVTFYHRDKDPYGTYVLDKLIPDIFPGKSIHHSNLTAYEWLDSIPENANFITFSIEFNPSKEDAEVMIGHVRQGGSLFISAEYFTGHFADTLNVATSRSLVPALNKENAVSDSILVKFSDSVSTPLMLKLLHNHAGAYFELPSTDSLEVLAYNDYHQPVFIRIRRGRGNIYLNTFPFAFTNINMLRENTAAFTERCLTYLPDENVFWTEYYHLGRLEAGSPIRYILSVAPLRWAYYIGAGTLLLYMVFAARRRQRAIPVVEPPSNTTLEFVQTIGNLYFRTADHKRIAEKRIAYFLENLRSRLHQPALQPLDDMVEVVSHKTGHPQQEVRQLFARIRDTWQKTELSENELKDLSEKLDKLTSHT